MGRGQRREWRPSGLASRGWMGLGVASFQEAAGAPPHRHLGLSPRGAWLGHPPSRTKDGLWEFVGAANAAHEAQPLDEEYRTEGALCQIALLISNDGPRNVPCLKRNRPPRGFYAPQRARHVRHNQPAGSGREGTRGCLGGESLGGSG